MYCLKKKTNRELISDEKVINLYDTGWSINDIVANHKVSVRRVRSILQEKGRSTASFRAAPDTIKECVMVLVASNISIRRISDTVDISPHLVRQVLRDNKVNASGLRKNSSLAVEMVNISNGVWNVFFEAYLSGELGFVKCAEKAGLNADGCAEAVLRLSDDEVETHKAKLHSYIADKRDTGLSASTIGKQLGVSAAIVKKIFTKSLTT